jgi:ribosomal protein L7/L12
LFIPKALTDRAEISETAIASLKEVESEFKSHITEAKKLIDTLKRVDDDNAEKLMQKVREAGWNNINKYKFLGLVVRN